MKKIVGVLLLAFVLIVQTFGVTAFAASDIHAAKQPDYSREGSISVELRTFDHQAVTEGALSAYLVAKAVQDDGNHSFVCQAPFGGEDRILDEEALSEENVFDLAKEFEEKATSAKSVQTVQLNEVGRAEFSGLELGVYLIVQGEPSERFESIEPFLVTVPLWNEETHMLEYDVNATPKVTPVYERAVYTPDVSKAIEVKSGTLSTKDVFVFRITPADASAPMPDNKEAVLDKSTGSMTVSRSGEGQVSFGEITYGLDDVGKTYNYTIEEVAGTDSHYEYDSSKYTMTVKVSKVDSLILTEVNYIDNDNQAAPKAAFTNVYDEKPPAAVPPKTPGGKLPQTGAIWWPAIASLIAGIFLFCLGYGIRRRYAKTR